MPRYLRTKANELRDSEEFKEREYLVATKVAGQPTQIYTLGGPNNVQYTLQQQEDYTSIPSPCSLKLFFPHHLLAFMSTKYTAKTSARAYPFMFSS